MSLLYKIKQEDIDYVRKLSHISEIDADEFLIVESDGSIEYKNNLIVALVYYTNITINDLDVKELCEINNKEEYLKEKYMEYFI